MDILILATESGYFSVNVFLASSASVVWAPEQKYSASQLLVVNSLKGWRIISAIKSAIQSSDRRRQQASAEIQSLFICFLKEQVSSLYFSLVVNNKIRSEKNNEWLTF